MADNNIKIKIEGIDNLTPVLNKINNTLEKINKTLSKFSTSSSKAFSSFDKDVSKTIKSNQRLKAEAIKTIKEIEQIYKKAETVGGFKNLSKAELGRIGGLTTKLKKLKEQLPKSERYSVEIAEFNRLATIKQRMLLNELKLRKKIQEEKKKESQIKWFKSIQSAKAQFHKLSIKDNFIKSQKDLSNFFQSVYRNSLSYERQFNTSRIKLIENSNREIKRKVIELVNELSNIYRQAINKGGFQFLSKKDIDKFYSLRNQLQKLKSVSPKDIQSFIESKEGKLDILKTDLLKRQIVIFRKEVLSNIDKINKEAKAKQERLNKEILNSQKRIISEYKRNLRAESIWQDAVWRDKQRKERLEERFFKHRLRLVRNSHTEEIRYLKRQISLQEKKIEQLLNEARLEGRLNVFKKFKIISEIRELSRLQKTGISRGVLLPEEARIRVAKFNSELKHLNSLVGTSRSLLHEWWKRFGAVALGFTVMYRTMLYVEMSIYAVIDAIKQGIQAFDTFQESTVRLSMFYQIFAGVNDMASSMKYATSTIEGLKVATVDALSPIEDITQGIDELAQHGVFLSATLMKDFVNLTDFIGMIAKTTGSQANQIRQELQALFEGTKRAGNTLIRFLSKLFGDEFVKQVQNARTPLEQFMKIMQKISRYMKEHKAELFERSFTLSLQKARNLFSLLINDAINLTNTLNGVKEKGFNPFASALNDALNRLGFDVYDRLLNLRLELAGLKSDLEKGKVSVSEYDKKQQEFQKTLAEFSKTPASSMILNLARAFNILANKVLPSVVNIVSGVVNSFSNFIIVVEQVYSKNKVLIDAVISVIKALLIFKAVTVTVSFVLREPLLLIISLSSKFLSFIPIVVNLSKKIPILSSVIGFLSASFFRLNVAIFGALAGLWSVFYSTFHPEKFKKLGLSAINSLGLAINEGLLKIVESLNNSSIFNVISMIFGVSGAVIESSLSKTKTVLEENVKYYKDKLNEVGNLKDNVREAIITTLKDLTSLADVISLKVIDIVKKIFDIKISEDKKDKFMKEIYSIFSSIDPKIIENKISQPIKDVLKSLDSLFSYNEKLLEFQRRFGIITSDTYYQKMIKLYEEYKNKYEEYLKTVARGTDEEIKIKSKLLDIEEKLYEIRDKYSKFKDIQPIKTDLETLLKSYEDVINKTNNLEIGFDIFSDVNPQYQQQIEGGINALKQLKENIKDVDARQKIDEEIQSYISKYEDLRKKAKETSITFAGTVKDVFSATFTEVLVNFKSTFNVVKNGMTDLVNNLTNLLANVFYDALSGKLKSLKDFVLELRNIVARVLSDILAKLIMIQSIKLISSAFGIPIPQTFANGGVVQGLRTGAFATGGIVSNPTLALIGEGRHKEAIVPLPDGRSIPAKVVDNQPQKTEVNIVNVVDPAIMDDYFVSGRGENVILNIVANNKYKIRQILNS